MPPSPELNNLVRLADHYIGIIVKETRDALGKESCDKIQAHIAANKVKEIFEQIKTQIKHEN